MVVTADQYADWMEKHLTTFGIFGNEYADRFRTAMLEWQRQFTRRLYTFDELCEATDEITGMTEPPRFAEGHLAAINSAISRVRERERQRKLNDAANNKGDTSCIMCRGTGVVVVPMFAPAEDPEMSRQRKQKRWVPERVVTWVNDQGQKTSHESYLTGTVACTFLQTCAGHGAGRGMTLDRYERLFPEWTREMARIEEIQRDAIRQAGVAHEGAFERLIESIIGRVLEASNGK